MIGTGARGHVVDSDPQNAGYQRASAALQRKARALGALERGLLRCVWSDDMTLTGVPEYFKGYFAAHRRARVSNFALLSLGNYVLVSLERAFLFTLVALHVTLQIWEVHL